MESQALEAPPIIVSLNEIEDEYQVPSTKTESQSVISSTAKAVGNKVVVTVCTESHKAALVNVVETTPVSAGLQEVAVAKVESDRLMVILNVVIESQALEAPPTIVSLNEKDDEYQVPNTSVESQSVMSSIAKAVGNRVVVMVCTESHEVALVNVVETTPVSAGLQDVAEAKVESDRLIVI